ncbi:hypothetical protein CRG98_040752 [Punica granatum]|uniref:RNase H type-1 domain-containing protein n=1 Tax=Punica granatum TaxID=22663 RepID=A0A2I0I4G2_PUNGR|nr:hypothetical protein CRG98_040752 [Punica granatum]
MVILFHDMMHKEIELYIDDMIAKSKEGKDRLVNLKRLFDRLKKYKLRLNPAKCTFDAKSGKLLGFVVSEKGIEVDHGVATSIDVRRQSLGCMLGQEDESTHIEHAIYYLSKKFTEGESNYPEIEKLCCALVWIMQRFRQYTLYHTIHLLSKADPLKCLLGSPSSMRNIAKWRCRLTEYDIEYVSRTSIKGQAIADHLAEFPIEDDTPINSDFPNEGILQVDAKVDFPCTNNVAEYEASILGLQAAINFKVKELEVFRDSMLTIFQTLGQSKTKDAKLVPYHEYLEELAENFKKISFTYTPHIKNQFADALVTLASMVSITKENLIESLEIEIAKGSAYYDTMEVTEEQPWYEDIKHFLQTGQYPTFSNRRDRKTLRRLAAHYFLSRETLYRRSFDATLLRCVDETEAQRLMGEIHEGSCAPHMSGLMLTKKLMRLGYFWSTMEADCAKHIRHCHLCKVYVGQIKAPPNELHPMAAPWPFSMWGHRCDRPYQSQSIQRTSVHFGGNRLLHQVD